MGDLNGKAALVTGGSRGIGAATARRLAADGAQVALTYAKSREPAEALVGEIEAAGGRALAVQADAADPASGARAVEATVQAFGRLDILVANAGVFELSPITAPDALEAFDRTFAVNVRGVVAVTAAAAQRLPDGGRVVVIGSVNADRTPFPGAAAYGASKAAVAALVRGWARDLGPRGITVNTVQPGPVDTEMNPADGDFAEMLKAQMAIPKYAEGRDIAGLVAWLASEEARYVTGAALTLDGGFLA